MSKLSIRPRNLDACKFIPIYKCEEIPDLHDYASINRSIPQLPTGMEKEEESEHHLQRAISAQQSKGTTGELVIPTPEVFNAPESFYNDLYPQSFKLPRQLIHVQPFAFENDIPEYDRDSEDEQWLENQKDIPNLTPIKFEELIDCFDKNSSQHVISLKEAKSLIKEDEDLIISVYDYWLTKRLRLQTPLIPIVKTERRDTSTTNNSNNPYIAFRRRTEKMQTRKNRKNDEISYEKMIKLRRDLSRALNLLQFVKQREETKKEHVKFSVDIFEKRYLLGDFNGNIINEITAQRQAANYLPINNVMKPNENKPPRNKDESGQPRKKREYRKRHRPEVIQRTEQELNEYLFTSDDEELNDNLSHSVSDQDEDDSDGPYAFKRKKGCQYHAPLTDSFGSWPFYPANTTTATAEERVISNNNNINNNSEKYCLTELRQDNRRFFSYARRRIGRGGRLIFDRLQLNNDDDLRDNDEDEEMNEEEDDNNFDYFKPKSPFKNHHTYLDSMDEDTTADLFFVEDGNSYVPVNLNDYLHEENDIYSNCKTRTDEDLARFKNHQKELIEMQKLQKEKLLMSKFNLNEPSSSSISLKSPSSSSNLDSLSSTSNNKSNNINLNQFNNVNHKSELSEQTLNTAVDLLNASSMCNKQSQQQQPSIITNHVNLNNSNSINNNNNSDLNYINKHTTSILPQKSSSSSSSTQLDLDSVKFAVSAVLGTVNNIQNNSTFNSNNGPSSNCNLEFDKLSSFSLSTSSNFQNQHSPSQFNSSNTTTNNLINSINLNITTASNQQSSFTNTLASQSFNQSQQPTLIHHHQQLITQPQQWPQQQQQSNELANSSNIFKLKFQNNQNNQNNLNSEAKLTPAAADVT